MREQALAAIPEQVRVASYTRISTDEERQPNSLGAQASRLEAFVASQPGWQLERRYEDRFTGTVIERPALQRLLRDAKLGRFDLLLVYRVDRFARSIRGLAQLIDELDQAGVVFRSATEPFDTSTPAGRMMVQMLGVFAEFERALIVERIVSGLERKAARGGWCGGQRPYGYVLDGRREHLEQHPTEAALVPLIFDLYAKQGLGSAALAHWLNERGHRTKTGRPWSRHSVLTVLRNRSYRGQIYYRGTWYDAPHQPLVDEALFERAQAILSRRGEDPAERRTNGSDYLLTGRVRCGRCGRAYLGTAAHGRHQRYTYYTCVTRHRYGTGHCDNDRLPAERLEQAVLERLRTTLANERLLERAVARAFERLNERQPQQDAELAATERKLADTRAALERYFRAFETGTMPEDACAPRIAALTEEAAGIERRRAELTQAAEIEDAPERVTPKELAELGQELEQALATGPVARRKAVVQALVDEITVESRAAIKPVFRVPAVRSVVGTMELAGLEPATSWVRSRRSPN